MMPLRTMYIAGSGMNYGASMLRAHAHNTANMNTEGHQDLEARSHEESSGVRVTLRQNAKPGHDPVANTVQRLTSQVVYRSNLTVMKVADEMTGELTDLFG